jgi:integrase
VEEVSAPEPQLAAAADGIGGGSFHALRHTHASQLIDAGVDIVTISRRLGHASPNITLGVYAHLFRKSDANAADAINAALAGAGKA